MYFYGHEVLVENPSMTSKDREQTKEVRFETNFFLQYKDSFQPNFKIQGEN